jgi:hypothetical protein
MLKKLAFLLVLFVTFLAQAQPRELKSLPEEIAKKSVFLSSIAGAGASSGTVVTATLANTTDSELRIQVDLAEPLFLANSGSSQNMVATQVFLEGGRYVSDGKRNFIVLAARSSQRIVFMAYCVDFEKDNPSTSDRFSVAKAPERLRPVMARISAHSQRNPNVDITNAAQAAVWLAQGVPLSEIRTKFSVARADAELALQFAQ